MSAEILREAAAKMRAETAVAMQPWGPEVALAVADWLDAAADRCLTVHNSTPEVWRGALAVARAYLGESA